MSHRRHLFPSKRKTALHSLNGLGGKVRAPCWASRVFISLGKEEVGERGTGVPTAYWQPLPVTPSLRLSFPVSVPARV